MFLIFGFHFVAADSGIDWLLGLERIRWSDPRTVLDWHYALEAWQWLLLVVTALTVASLSYRRLLGPVYARVGLVVLRALILILVVSLLLGPTLTLIDQYVEPDWLYMLVDRSESMTIEDAIPVEDDLSKSGPVSRDVALRRGLARHEALFADEQFLKDRRVKWLGFDANTFEIAPPWATSVPSADETEGGIGGVGSSDSGVPGRSFGEPKGQATALRTAIKQTLQRSTGRPVAGVVLLTDGRTPQSTGAQLIQRLRGIPLFTVPLGGDVIPTNFAIRRVDAPKKAFIKDDVPVEVWIDLDPPGAIETGVVDMSRLMVRLVETETDLVLDERPWPRSSIDQPMTLIGRPAAAGQFTWRVTLDYDASVAQSIHSDPVLQDNAWTFDIELLDQMTRVLYVEGYPRWEYRFLKNLLVRERTIESSMLLVSADRDFAQEGDTPIARLPSSPAEWSQYNFDVVVFGDVPPEYLSPDQMMMLRDQVAIRGAGLLWIGGPFHTPKQYDGTVLADLLPMRLPGAVDRIGGGAPIAMRPWPLAKALNVLQLRSEDQSAEQVWPEGLPSLFWVQDLRPLKQAAEVLAASTADPTASQALPMVVRMRYGAGQIVYVATDETWRWRFGRGEVYFGQFWVGLVRMLGRHLLQQHVEGVRFDVSHRRSEVGQNLVVRLDVEDAMLLERDLRRIAVGVFRDSDRDRALERLELHPVVTGSPGSSGGRDSDLTRLTRHYRANWRPALHGRLLLRVVEPSLDHLDIHLNIEVVRADAEMRRTQPDHQRLIELARDSGGNLINLDELDQLKAAVPRVARVHANDDSEPLWNSPLSLMLVLVLLTIEWVGRKMIRLV